MILDGGWVHAVASAKKAAGAGKTLTEGTRPD